MQDEEKKKKRKKLLLISLSLLLLILIVFVIHIYLLKNFGNCLFKKKINDNKGIIKNYINVIPNEVLQDDFPIEQKNTVNTNINNNNNAGNKLNQNTNVNNAVNENNNKTEKVKIPEFKIESEDFKWGVDTKLKVFRNIELNHSVDVIWPGATGEYPFKIINTLDELTNYTVNFEESNIANIELKYKVIRNGEYLINDWSYIKDINIERNDLQKNEEDNYILEWKWFEKTESEDMKAMGKPYSINIKIYMEKE